MFHYINRLKNMLMNSVNWKAEKNNDIKYIF